MQDKRKGCLNKLLILEKGFITFAGYKFLPNDFSRET
jgi:hypothetical protein